MRLPDQILNTVCFIAKSAAKDTYRSTGFIVSVAGAQGNPHLYLVTAKHVARSVAMEPSEEAAKQDIERSQREEAMVRKGETNWRKSP